jgi:hypothetical protein
MLCKNSSSDYLTKHGFKKIILCNGEESWEFMKWAWATFGAGMTLNQVYTSDTADVPSDVKWIVDNSDFYIHDSIAELIVLAWS